MGSNKCAANLSSPQERLQQYPIQCYFRAKFFKVEISPVLSMPNLKSLPTIK